jgi:hypothetical protein
MNKNDFLLEKEVSFTVNGTKKRYLVANMHKDRDLISMFTKSLNLLQGIRTLEDDNVTR